LPHAEGPEKSILSTCFQEPDMIAHLLEAGISPSTFYIPAHGIIYKHFCELFQADEAIELISFSKRLQDHDQLENIGGATGLTEVYTYAPSAGHFEHHLEIVVDTHRRRQTILYESRLAGACYDETEDLYQDLLMEGAEEIVEGSRLDRGTVSGGEAVDDWQENFEKKQRGEESDVVACGISCLDGLRGGIDNPGLTYIGAFPSTGKTALWIQMMCYRLDRIIREEVDEQILFFTLEMTPRQVITRAVIHLAGLNDPRKITDPHEFDLTWEEEQAIQGALEILGDYRLRIVDCAGITVTEIEARAKLEAKRRKICLIGVDYIQRVMGSEDGVEQRMMKISSGLQRMWKRHRCSVVGLSQLTETKEGETRLKYAEALEEDADLSVRIERKKDEDRVTGLYLTKDRHRGYRFHRLKCHFNKYLQRFYTPEDHE